MGLKAWNAGVIVAVAVLWFASGTQREKPVVSALHTERVRAAEDRAIQAPGDAARQNDLAQAYLDARAPGMAIQSIEAALPAVRSEPIVQHTYARALLDQGRSQDALVIERRVLDRCADPATRCSTWLIASATRRADILAELVQLGVEDAQAQPERSALAYQNATRSVGLEGRK